MWRERTHLDEYGSGYFSFIIPIDTPINEEIYIRANGGRELSIKTVQFNTPQIHLTTRHLSDSSVVTGDRLALQVVATQHDGSLVIGHPIEWNIDAKKRDIDLLIMRDMYLGRKR